MTSSQQCRCDSIHMFQHYAFVPKGPMHSHAKVSQTSKTRICTAGCLSFHPIAQCAVNALEGRVRHRKHKYFFQWVQTLGTPRYSSPFVATEKPQKSDITCEIQSQQGCVQRQSATGVYQHESRGDYHTIFTTVTTVGTQKTGAATSVERRRRAPARAISSE